MHERVRGGGEGRVEETQFRARKQSDKISIHPLRAAPSVCTASGGSRDRVITPQARRQATKGQRTHSRPCWGTYVPILQARKCRASGRHLVVRLAFSFMHLR